MLERLRLHGCLARDCAATAAHADVLAIQNHLSRARAGPEHVWFQVHCREHHAHHADDQLLVSPKLRADVAVVGMSIRAPPAPVNCQSLHHAAESRAIPSNWTPAIRQLQGSAWRALVRSWTLVQGIQLRAPLGYVC